MRKEPELRPEYVKKALKIHKEKGIEVGTVENLRKMIESYCKTTKKHMSLLELWNFQTIDGN